MSFSAIFKASVQTLRPSLGSAGYPTTTERLPKTRDVDDWASIATSLPVVISPPGVLTGGLVPIARAIRFRSTGSEKSAISTADGSDRGRGCQTIPVRTTALAGSIGSFFRKLSTISRSAALKMAMYCEASGEATNSATLIRKKPKAPLGN